MKIYKIKNEQYLQTVTYYLLISKSLKEPVFLCLILQKTQKYMYRYLLKKYFYKGIFQRFIQIKNLV